MSNIRNVDRRKTIPPEFYQSLLDDIFLHFSLKFEFENNILSILSKLKSFRDNMNEFICYFES